MSNYFDEHNWAPLGENEGPNEYLLLARLLLDSGIATAMGLDYSNLSASANSNLAPPTSQDWLKTQFPTYCFDESELLGFQCPICLLKFNNNNNNSTTENNTTANKGVKLPDCGHTYHAECLLRWLRKTSSCPMCRQEFPTDDQQYEEFKKQKRREKVRERELADLHDSMFS